MLLMSFIKDYPLELELSYSKNRHLRCHKLNKHLTDQKKFKCDRCELSFAVEQSLKRHVMAVHDLIKPFECPECKKAFNDKGNMRQHVKVVHQGIREHKCTMCEKDFVRRIELQRHIDSNHASSS